MVKPPGHPPGWMIRLVSSVTEPWLGAGDPSDARALPFSVAAVTIVIEALARMVPTNVVDAPMVAELPTCQKMLDALAPPLRSTARPDVMVNVDDEAVRRNRMSLLRKIGGAVAKIADVTKIVVDRSDYRAS